MNINKITRWLEIASRTHEYWSNRIDENKSNSINEISIKFDDSWDCDSREEFMESISQLFTVKENRIILQHDKDTAWNDLVASWNKQGIENVQHHVTLVLESDRAYFTDDLGRKSKTFCSKEGNEWFSESENRIPWFQWIP